MVYEVGYHHHPIIIPEEEVQNQRYKTGFLRFTVITEFKTIGFFSGFFSLIFQTLLSLPVKFLKYMIMTDLHLQYCYLQRGCFPNTWPAGCQHSSVTNFVRTTAPSAGHRQQAHLQDACTPLHAAAGRLHTSARRCIFISGCVLTSIQWW